MIMGTIHYTLFGTDGSPCFRVVRSTPGAAICV